MNIGMKNRIHFCHGTLTIARAAIKYSEVEYSICAKPPPSWKARTAVCHVTPARSAKGVIIGIVTNAWPLPEGMTKLIANWTNYISATLSTPGKSLTVAPNPCTIFFHYLSFLKYYCDSSRDSNNKGSHQRFPETFIKPSAISVTLSPAISSTITPIRIKCTATKTPIPIENEGFSSSSFFHIILRKIMPSSFSHNTFT